jgi:hypothetical protein
MLFLENLFIDDLFLVLPDEHHLGPFSPLSLDLDLDFGIQAGCPLSCGCWVGPVETEDGTMGADGTSLSFLFSFENRIPHTRRPGCSDGSNQIRRVFLFGAEGENVAIGVEDVEDGRDTGVPADLGDREGVNDALQ